MASSGEANPSSQPAVRFSSVNQEISPEPSLSAPSQSVSAAADASSTRGDLTQKAQEELRDISKTIQTCRLQAKRFEGFAFEPVSLPVSRVPSPSSSLQAPHGRQSEVSSTRSSPQISVMHSPPLTPADTQNAEGKSGAAGSSSQAKGNLDPAMMTPQVSPPHEPPPISIESSQSTSQSAQNDQKWLLSTPQARSPKEYLQSSQRPKSMSDMPGVVSVHPKQGPNYIIGPSGDSLPVSRQPSPTGSGTVTPGATTPGASTPTFSRPMTPAWDPEDPYARSKRPPQNKNLDAIDARFIFGGRDAKKSNRHSVINPVVIPRTNLSESRNHEKRHSFFGGMTASTKIDISSLAPPAIETHDKLGKSHGSMSDLKRFFKLGSKHKEKRSDSPAPSIKSNKSGYRTPPTPSSGQSVPFADDHGLQSKYGKFGKVLGSGAGGSVRLMKRSSDGVTFAVKQFRPRHSYESEREYNKKVTAEFCVGSTLHHGNIIETLDLVHEKGSWYVVMEYAPYDLFAIVMTGKMSREEVTCATLQILSGVTYLHSMGLAHRDLKLDNVVVNEQGIMKIIDFGSAVVFRYPFEKDVVLASGIVGSDPYLAPEVYDLSKYDPQPTDIWSLAIIFCCMTLRRFPWKAPRVSDNSYKLFVAAPNDAPKRATNDHPNKSATELHDSVHEERKHGAQSEPASRQPSSASPTKDNNERHNHHNHNRSDHNSRTGGGDNNNSSSSNNATTPVTPNSAVSPSNATSGKEIQSPSTQQQVIKGPWRLLRLLPRESRHIIGRMLEVDPKKRATMAEIIADKWVANASVCRQEESSIIRAEGHEHTLEPGSNDSSVPPSKK